MRKSYALIGAIAGFAGSMLIVAAVTPTFGDQSWLHKYQSLIGGMLALTGAGIAAVQVHASMDLTDRLERRRVRSKRDAARAVLSLHLSSLTDYFLTCAAATYEVTEQCDGQQVPADITMRSIPAIPWEAVEALKELTEHEAPENRSFIAALLSTLQVQAARLKALEANTFLEAQGWWNLQYYYFDSIISLARTHALYDYARQETEQFPPMVNWGQVRDSVPRLGGGHTGDWIGDLLERRSLGNWEKIVEW